MKTTIETFNLENWTGEQTTIEVLQFGSKFEWEFNGFTVSLVNRKVYDGGAENFVIYDVKVGGCKTDHKVGATFSADDRPFKGWKATNWDGSFTRQGSTPAMAVTRFLANLL